MLAWMLYATFVGVLLTAAGALLEERSPWLVGRRRMVWLSVIAGALLLAAVVTVVQTGPRTNLTATPQIPSSAHEASPPTVVSTDVLPREPVANALAQSELPANTADGRTLSLDILLIIAWISCSALCIIVLLASAWRVSYMRRSWRESVIAGVPVLVSHDVGPAVIGLVHHGIVVPSWVEALRDDEQRTVMTHEREHVRAGDPLLLWGATLLVALAPWNAALWYSLRRLRHAIEMDCDARVLRSRPDAHAYCTLLLDVGERTLAGVAPMAALAEPATLLERRIEAMTAPANVRQARVALSGVAALLLIAAACWAPRPAVAPRARIAALVAELNLLLAKDSSQQFLTAQERAGAVRAVTTSTPYTAQALHDSIASWQEELTPRIDDALKQVFPQLYTRTDTSHVMVTLTYDYKKRLKGHSLRPMPKWQHYEAPDFSNVQIQLFGLVDRPEIHAMVVYVLEKWDISAEPRVTAYGGLYGPADSKNVPPTRQYAHRVDSLARADFPEAFGTRDDAIVVTVLFSAKGDIVRGFAKHFTVDEVFDVVPGTVDRPLAMRSSTYLLSRTIGAPSPKLTSFGAQTMRDAPHAIFVFGELAMDAPLQPELSRDSLLKLASHYESTTVHGISNGTSFVALRFDRNGVVIAHSNVGYGPKMTRPSVTSMRQSIFGIESTNDNDEARVVLLRAGEPDAMPGPLYALVVRPRG